MGWSGRIAYLSAKNEVKQIELYGWDLVWKTATSNMTGDVPMPSAIWNNKHKVDKRSTEQIVNDLINGLGGD